MLTSSEIRRPVSVVGSLTVNVFDGHGAMQRSGSNGEHAAESGVRSPAARGVTGNVGAAQEMERDSTTKTKRETGKRIGAASYAPRRKPGAVSDVRFPMRRLPTLRVESACREDWSAMTPRAEGRHCGHCAKTVIDLSRVTHARAVAILRDHGGAVCGRVRANAHGDALFAPEPVTRGVMPVALAGLLAACAAEPLDAPPAEPTEAAVTADADPHLGLAIPTSGSFGGSLATGVMMPIGPEAPIVPCVASVDTPAQQDEAIEPTDEQRALTRRKHHRQRPSYPPPITHHLMGVMALPD
jgi:hypothetical protein